MNLLYQYNGWAQQRVQAGGRIWYDLTESSDTAVGRSLPIPQDNSELRGLLDRRGVLTVATTQSPAQTLPVSRRAIDLSGIYPRMFVRVRDPITHNDSSARFPGLDELVAQANQAPDQYAGTYVEYKKLMEIFRAYVVAVRATRQNSSLCSNLPKGLLDAEKVRSPLPAYHPTDFTMTIGWYEYGEQRGRRAIAALGGLFQGGVAIGADQFLENATSTKTLTPIIAALETAGASPAPPSWIDASGREFVVFDVVGAEAGIRSVASNASSASVIDAADPNGDIENAPPPQLRPSVVSWSANGTNAVLFVLVFLLLAAFIGARPRSRRG